MLYVNCKISGISELKIVFDEHCLESVELFNETVRFKISDFVQDMLYAIPRGTAMHLQMAACEDDMLVSEYLKLNIGDILDLDSPMHIFFNDAKKYFCLQKLRGLGT